MPPTRAHSRAQTQLVHAPFCPTPLHNTDAGPPCAHPQDQEAKLDAIRCLDRVCSGDVEGGSSGPQLVVAAGLVPSLVKLMGKDQDWAIAEAALRAVGAC
jgi:hypothetical protein